jgi:hypothetical protein
MIFRTKYVRIRPPRRRQPLASSAFREGGERGYKRGSGVHWAGSARSSPCCFTRPMYRPKRETHQYILGLANSCHTRTRELLISYAQANSSTDQQGSSQQAATATCNVTCERLPLRKHESARIAPHGAMPPRKRRRAFIAPPSPDHQTTVTTPRRPPEEEVEPSALTTLPADLLPEIAARSDVTRRSSAAPRAAGPSARPSSAAS